MQRHALDDAAGRGARKRLIQHSLGLLLAISVFVTLAPLAYPAGPWTWGMGVMAVTAAASVLYVFALWLNARGHTVIAARWMVTGLTGAVLGAIFVPGGVSEVRSFAFVFISVLVAATALSWRAGLIVAGVNGVALGVVALTRLGYAPGAFQEDLLVLAMFSGVILAFAAYSEREVRSRAAAQEELHRSLWQMEAMLNNGPDAVAILGGDGRLLRLNQLARAWSLRHLHTEALPGDSLRTIIGERGWSRVSPLLERASVHATASEEFNILTTRGPIWIDVHVRQVEGPERVFVAQVRDATHAKQTELRERGAYRERLELLKLREIDMARTRLLNRASHEMRTPMTPLRLQISVLERHLAATADERTRHSLETIKRNVARLAGLVDDLLDASAFESADIGIKPRPIDLANVLSAEVEAYRPRAEAKGLRLHLECSIDEVIQADPHRLAQVMNNLLSNAGKYADKEVRVKGWAQGEEVRVCVQDDGVGFPPANESELWRPFAQIGDDQERLSGTGLGLFLCRRIIEHHGGQIWAESEGPGTGARFTFALPRHATLKYEGEPMVLHE